MSPAAAATANQYCASQYRLACGNVRLHAVDQPDGSPVAIANRLQLHVVVAGRQTKPNQAESLISNLTGQKFYTKPFLPAGALIRSPNPSD